jgi:hypothetical protein
MFNFCKTYKKNYQILINATIQRKDVSIDEQIDHILDLVDQENDRNQLNTGDFVSLISRQFDNVLYWGCLKNPVKSQLELQKETLQMMLLMIQGKNIVLPHDHKARIILDKYKGNVNLWFENEGCKDEEE